MFRRKPKPIVKETEFPADLEKLGLFINDEDELRQIERPEEKFDYWIHGKSSKLDGSTVVARLNERRREAVDECIRRRSVERMLTLGFELVRIPPYAADADPHLHILCTPNLPSARKVLVLAPDSFGSDLSIWSLRWSTDHSVRAGSMEPVAAMALKAGYGVIIANPCQLFWDGMQKKALTHVSWNARNRGVSVKPSAKYDSEAVKIPDNTSPEQHLASVFKYLALQLHPAALVDVVAVGYTARGVLEFLEENWAVWEKYIHGLALAESPHSLRHLRNPNFRSYLAAMARNWVVSSEPVGKELDEMHHRFGMATFSSGQEWTGEIVPACADLIAQYLADTWIKPGECNPLVPVVIGDDLENEEERESWMEAMRKLNLADPTYGWDVPGSEEVAEIRRQQEEKDEKEQNGY